MTQLKNIHAHTHIHTRPKTKTSENMNMNKEELLRSNREGHRKETRKPEKRET